MIMIVSDIEVNSMGVDFVQLVDRENNRNSKVIRFMHYDSRADKVRKIVEGREKLISERV